MAKKELKSKEDLYLFIVDKYPLHRTLESDGNDPHYDRIGALNEQLVKVVELINEFNEQIAQKIIAQPSPINLIQFGYSKEEFEEFQAGELESSTCYASVEDFIQLQIGKSQREIELWSDVMEKTIN